VTFQWERSTQRDKIALYEVVLPLVRRRGLDWQKFWDKLGIAVGVGYERNFRRGEISSANAQRIFDWMATDFPETTKHLLEVLLDARDSLDPDNPWEAFVAEHGQFSNLELAEVNLPRYRHAPAYYPKASRTPAREPIPIQTTVKFFQRYTFRIDSPFNGRVLGMQRSGGVWWPIPISDTRLRKWPYISQGTTWMPYDPESKRAEAPSWLLSETEDPGLHLVVFLILKDGGPFRNHFSNTQHINSKWLKKIAADLQQLPKETWRVFRLNVMFKPLDEP
jgi:hypothetical protein